MSKLSLIKEGAQDLFELLERNFIEKKPLLDGAKMYRGTSTPVQEGGVLSNDVMHATLLPRTATVYTHNHQSGQAGYIGEYKLDRETTTFHKDYGLESKLNGKASGMSVEQAEAALHPKVSAIVNARDESTKRSLRYDLEKFISKEMHEAPLSAKTASKPDALYYYTGQPNSMSNKATLQDMTQITESNSKLAKETLLNNYRGPTAQKLHTMSWTDQGIFAKASVAEANVARDALSKLASMSQPLFVKEVRENYGHMPLPDMVKAVANHIGHDTHKHIDKMADMLANMWKSDNPAYRQAGHAAAEMIAKLPDGSTLKDAVQALTAGTSLIKGKHSSHGASHGDHAQESQVRLRDFSREEAPKHDSVPKELVANRASSAPSQSMAGLER